jgi:hypothetical protein
MLLDFYTTEHLPATGQTPARYVRPFPVRPRACHAGRVSATEAVAAPARQWLRRLRFGALLTSILALLFGVPWWTLVVADAAWPGALPGLVWTRPQVRQRPHFAHEVVEPRHPDIGTSGCGGCRLQ